MPLKKMVQTMRNKSMMLGQGGRFQKGKEEMMSKGMPEEEASAIMAKAGRKKYGAKRMNNWAQAGRKK